MIFKLTGQVDHVGEIETYDQKRNRQKVTIIVTTGNHLDENRIEYIPIDLMDEDTGLIAQYGISTGDLVELDCELRGRKYVDGDKVKKYLNVQAHSIRVI